MKKFSYTGKKRKQTIFGTGTKESTDNVIGVPKFVDLHLY